jgi:hypothetical protein
MALEITAAGDAKLRISGTATELASIYSRIEFGFKPNGVSSQGALYNYGAKAQYEASPGELLKLDGFKKLYSFDIDTATEEQSLETGHAKVKAALEDQGYTVAIVDLPS